MLSLLASTAAAGLPQPAQASDTPSVVSAGQLEDFYDDTLAYRFKYPVSTTSGTALSVIRAKGPEKYSSSAPLTADARQRIVAELADLRKFVTYSVCVGPASGVLKGVSPAAWKPYDVALTVLIDRSTSRLTTGQRFALNDVEQAVNDDRADGRYYVYEHRSQGSPTAISSTTKESYRHALAVTGVRPDSQGVPYLYTLNLSCREEMWPELQPLFKEAVQSFSLVPPTAAYISPDTNPWQFW